MKYAILMLATVLIIGAQNVLMAEPAAAQECLNGVCPPK